MVIKSIRQIALDTETTGMNQTGIHYEGHKIIEIGAVEIINRRLTGNNFHVYINPNRSIDSEAHSVHGITNEFLINKPIFKEIANEFLNYIKYSELIIHHAHFDIGFINYELDQISHINLKIENICKITDSLALARNIFPGKRNNLDALCTRYGIDNSKRTLHGALLDAHILADVYLAMTSGQTSIQFNIEDEEITDNTSNCFSTFKREKKLNVISASHDELLAHEDYLDYIVSQNSICLWRE